MILKGLMFGVFLVFFAWVFASGVHSAKVRSYGVIAEDSIYYYVDKVSLSHYAYTIDFSYSPGEGVAVINTDKSPDREGRIKKSYSDIVVQAHGRFFWVGDARMKGSGFDSIALTLGH